MKFFSAASINNTSNTNVVMPIRYRQPALIQQPVVNQLAISQTPDSNVKKVKWGEPTWFLFHTLSVKVKDSDFQNIRVDLLNRIYAISTNLPCPDCANHAKLYLDGINFNSIQTKDDLKRMLFIFHNEVNKRKGYPQFPYEELDSKYSLAVTNNIIRNFMHHFSDRNRSIKLMASDLFRATLCELLKTWFNENIHSFAA